YRACGLVCIGGVCLCGCVFVREREGEREREKERMKHFSPSLISPVCLSSLRLCSVSLSLSISLSLFHSLSLHLYLSPHLSFSPLSLSHSLALLLSISLFLSLIPCQGVALEPYSWVLVVGEPSALWVSLLCSAGRVLRHS